MNIFTQIDWVFYIILIIAVLFGFLRGFKKTLFNFIVMAIFYIVFFVTLNTMVDTLWSMDLGFLGSTFANIDPSLSDFSSFENDYQSIIQVLFNNSFDFTQSEMDALAVGLMQFVVKIVWAIAYFTVILIIYKLLTGLIRLIFVRNKKNKHRLMGGVVGVLNGAMAVFVTLIILGGTVSFIESASILLPDETTNAEEVSFQPRPTIFDLNQSMISQDQIRTLSESDPLVPQETVDMINDLVDGYNNNIIVKIANGIEVDSEFNQNQKVPLHINLFDQVLSFEYQDQAIALRHELSIFLNAYSVIDASDFGETGEITDIKGGDIRSAFAYLEESVLLPTIMPIAIKYFAEENEIQLSISDSQLYDYDYSDEIGRLSSIIAGVFDLLNEEEVSIDADGNEVTIDGDWVKDIFQDVADSRVILLLTEAFLVPAIQDNEGTLSQLVEIGDDFDWSNEYLALGDILAEMVEADVSISTIESAEANELLATFSQVDPTVLLNSEIITDALINILNKETDIEGLEVLSVPANINWRSTETTTGELEYILLAIQAILSEQSDFNASEFDVDLLNSLSSTTIDAVLDSYIIRATITDQIATLELGDIGLTVPDEAEDAQDYFTKEELSALIGSIKLLYDDLETFDLDTLFNMDEANYATLFESTIIRATITEQLSTFDLGADTLVIPNDVYETPEMITSVELIDVMLAIKVIYDDIDTFDIDVLYGLDNSDYDTMFTSKIIRATITNKLESFNLGSFTLVIPDDVYDTSDYMSKNELTALMNSISMISSDVDTFTVDALFSLTEGQMTSLFDSAIMQATVSDIILSYAIETQNPSQMVLIVPSQFRESITVDTLSQDQIIQAELIDILLGLDAIGVSGFDGGIDPALIGTGLDFDLIMNSGSLHVSIDNIIDSNAQLEVPLLAEDTLYGLSNITVKSEIIALIDAVDAFSTSADVSDVTFDFNTIAGLTTTEQNTILESMIVRNIITDDVETAVGIDPFYSLDASDYMSNNTSLFLTKQGVLDYIDHLNP